MNLNVFKNNKILIWCLIAFFLSFGVRIYAISLKQDLHQDEALSILLSNYSDYGWTTIPENNKELTGKQLKQAAYWNDGTLKDTINDIKNLYLYTRDDPHTNFYYSFLRLAFTGVDNFEIKQTIIRGGILNLCFFSLSFFFMFKLLNLVFKKELIPLGLVAAFLNPATISNTVLIRPYQLQETLFIALTYVFVKFYIELKDNNADFKIKNSLLIAFVVALNFLTGYYSSIYIGFLAIVAIFFSIKNKDRNLGKFLKKTATFSVIFTTLMYPVYFLGFFSYRVSDSLEAAFDIWNNIILTLQAFPLIYLAHIFSLSLIFYLIFLKIKNKTSKNSTVLMLFWIGFIWSFIVLYIAPMKHLRYIMPVFPILSMIIPYAVQSTSRRFLPTLIVCSILFLNLLIGFNFFKHPNLGRYIFLISKFEFFKNNKVDKFLFTENATIPVIILKQQPVLSQGEILQISNILPYFEDKQKYLYIDVNEIKNLKYTHFYAIVPKFPKAEYSKRSLPLYEGFERIEIQDCSSFYSCIEFKR